MNRRDEGKSEEIIIRNKICTPKKRFSFKGDKDQHPETEKQNFIFKRDQVWYSQNEKIRTEREKVRFYIWKTAGSDIIKRYGTGIWMKQSWDQQRKRESDIWVKEFWHPNESRIDIRTEVGSGVCKRSWIGNKKKAESELEGDKIGNFRKGYRPMDEIA